VQRFHVNGRVSRRRLRFSTENIANIGKTVVPALFDLVGMNIKGLSKFAKCLIFANGCLRYLRFENRRVITAWTSRPGASLVDGKVCQLQVENPLIPNVQICQVIPVCQLQAEYPPISTVYICQVTFTENVVN